MFDLLLAIIYLAFISLGLPDSLLGSAWPSIYPELGVPISYAGAISMMISVMTVISSLMSDRLNRRFGTGKITAASTALTALALFGFSVSWNYYLLLLWAIPYGLGAGSIDSALNNYVALHYQSRHMSWLHCFWGIGAAVGPYIMGLALTANLGWNMGYRIIGSFQIILAAALFFSLPLWNRRKTGRNESDETNQKSLSLREIIRIPGAKAVMICFLCYCGIEQTAGLWASSYLTIFKGISAETAATYAGLFFIGITVGRAVSGFMTLKFNDTQMIKIGIVLIAVGIAAMLLPFGQSFSLIGLIVIGLGCAPIYPSIIHSTPDHFGAEHSQAVIGVQMAAAYVGTSLLPPIFGFLADRITIALFPLYILILLVLMTAAHNILEKRTAQNKNH